MKKTLLWFAVGGLLAYPIEGFWRIPSNGGWVSIYMIFVYGLCFWLVGGINQIPLFYTLSMRLQALIGTVIVLIVEFVSGYIFNIRVGLNIWDYSSLPFNLLGQICLLFGILWFFLMPFAIWLEDKLNYYWEQDNGWKSAYNYTLWQAYKELFFGKAGVIND